MNRQGHIISLGLSVALMLAACANAQPRAYGDPDDHAAPARNETPAPAAPVTQPGIPETVTNIDPEVLYHVLSAEILGQRSDYATATRMYVKAAMASEDPEIAERATRVALFAKDAESAQLAAARWLELEPDNPAAHRNLAALALREGSMIQAADHLGQVLDYSSEQGQAWLLITELLRYARDIDGALEVMSKLVDEYPDDAEAYLAFAALLHQKGVEDQALEEINKAFDLQGAWPEALSLRSAIYQDLGQLEQAQEDLADAVGMEPADEILRIRYAELLRQMGRYDAAQAQLAELPQDSAVLVQRAFVALAAEDHTQAEEFARQLLRFGEDRNAAYFILARVAEERGDIDTALAEYAKIDDGRFYPQAQTRAAYLMAENGRLDDARELLRRLRADNVDLSEDLYLAEGDLLVQSGLENVAFDLYTRAIEEAPNSTSLRYARALLAETLDRLDITENDLREIIQREPDNAVALNALGYTLADRTDRYQEALALIDEAYRLQPDEAAIVDSMGWIHYRLGNLDEALMYLRRALDLGYDPEIAAHFGEVLWIVGEHDHARLIWADALERTPESDIVQETMKRFGQ